MCKKPVAVGCFGVAITKAWTSSCRKRAWAWSKCRRRHRHCHRTLSAARHHQPRHLGRAQSRFEWCSDIALGLETTNFGMIKTLFAKKGAGSNSLHWHEAFDMLPDDESDPEPIRKRYYPADAALPAAARTVEADVCPRQGGGRRDRLGRLLEQ